MGVQVERVFEIGSGEVVMTLRLINSSAMDVEFGVVRAKDEGEVEFFQRRIQIARFAVSHAMLIKVLRGSRGCCFRRRLRRCILSKHGLKSLQQAKGCEDK